MSPPRDERRSDVSGLVAVLSLAVILRVLGMRFGLPHTLARPDEDATVAIALKFFTRSFNPGFFDWPSLFMYVTTVAFVGYFQFGRLLGWFPYESRFLAAATRNQAPLRVITRSLSAAAGVLTVATVYAIGRRLFDRTIALVGAFFLAVAALHVRDSHFGVTDVAATFLVTWSFLHTVAFAQTRRPRDWIASALLAGAAASTKYNAGLVVLPGLYAIVLGAAQAHEAWSLRVRRFVAYIALAIVAFFAGTPYALIDRPAFLAALESITAHLRGGHAAMAGPGWVVHAASSLRYGVGLPILIAGALGFLVYAVRDRRLGILFLIFPAAYYAFIGAGETAFARYIIPVVPFLCLAAAYPIVEAARAAARWSSRPQFGSGGRVDLGDRRGGAVARDRDPLGHAVDEGRQPADRGQLDSRALSGRREHCADRHRCGSGADDHGGAGHAGAIPCAEVRAWQAAGSLRRRTRTARRS